MTLALKTAFNVFIPPAPSIESKICNELTTVALLPIVPNWALNTSFPAPPVKLAPVSALVVTMLIWTLSRQGLPA